MLQTLSANCAGAMFDVCEPLVPPRAVVVHAVCRVAFRGAGIVCKSLVTC